MGIEPPDDSLADWSPPRCTHGHIILSCVEDNCPAQTAYLDQQNAALRDYYERQIAAARAAIRAALGLDGE